MLDVHKKEVKDLEPASEPLNTVAPLKIESRQFKNSKTKEFKRRSFFESVDAARIEPTRRYHTRFHDVQRTTERNQRNETREREEWTDAERKENEIEENERTRERKRETERDHSHAGIYPEIMAGEILMVNQNHNHSLSLSVSPLSYSDFYLYRAFKEEKEDETWSKSCGRSW